MTKKTILLLVLLLFIVGILIFYFYPEKKLPSNSVIDHIKVYKSKRQLLAYNNGKLLKTYRISLGKNPIGHKEFEGDSKTPEGIYYINDKNPNSGYYKNLGVSYPNEKDMAYAKTLGKSAGGDIKIHGLRNGIGFLGKFQRYTDWTAGCIAVTNNEIDELFTNVKIGVKIEILP
ncbi:L,D-transpeptidase family protein [Flavobacterium sp.]|uniref:L,D-transpeptidase family protein n=1 Tax=Flavobacterium sp. TaxID=239 RepID=UPI00286D9AD7|nr:L,D-transpeptidase family protein [Flavobacterium sp.]